MSGTSVPRRYAGRPESAPPGYVPGSDDLLPPMDAVRAPTRAGRMWLVKAVSGILLVAFLGLHLVAQHFLVPGGLRDFDAVVDYLRHPVALVAELGLLGSVIVHAALGVRAVLVDTLATERAVRRASWAIGAIGLAAFAYGIFLTFTVIA